MKRILCLCLMLAMLLPAALADEQLHLMQVKQLNASPEVRLYVNADNAPNDENFTVFLNKQPLREPLTVQPISETGEGTVYVFCLDVSGTISKKDMNAAREALAAFCERLRPADLMRVYAIGIGAEPLCDYTADPEVIRQALSGITRRAQKTYLWQCVSMAADDLAASRDGLPELAQIIVFSDGIDDSDGTASAATALKSVQDCGAPLRVILMSSSQVNADNSALKWLCEESGGKLFDGQARFEQGLNGFLETLDDDYCVNLTLPYDLLEGDAEWYVQQILGDRVYASNLLHSPLTREGLPTPTPTPSPTPSPTPVPTPTPTPEPTVAPIGNPKVSIGGSTGESGGIPFIEDTVEIQWGAEGAVDHYIAYVENQAGDSLNRITTTNTTWSLSASMFKPELYTVHVGAVPVNGTLEDARWAQATFGVPAPTPTPSPTPTPTPTPSPTPTPAPVSSVCWLCNGAAVEPDAQIVLSADQIELTLSAEGAVKDAAVRVLNEGGEDVTGIVLPDGVSGAVEGRTVVIEKRLLNRGETYTVAGTVRALNPEEDAQEVAVRVTVRKLPIWLFVCLGALALLLVLILIIARLRRRLRRKKKSPEPEIQPEPPQKDESPTLVAARPTGQEAVVRRVVFTETIGSADEPHETTYVISGSAMIGRDPDCAIFYKGASREERTVSRRQARLVLDRRGRLYIEPEAKASNPTCVDGAPIQRRVDLQIGSRISMGEITLVVKQIEEVHRN